MSVPNVMCRNGTARMGFPVRNGVAEHRHVRHENAGGRESRGSLSSGDNKISHEQPSDEA
jgi:hypothetical protein